MPLPIAVLISGGGRSLKNLIDRQQSGRLAIEIRLVMSSAAGAGGLAHASAAGIPTAVVERRNYADDEAFGAANWEVIRKSGAQIVVLAGYLKFLPIPPDFENRVVNIHPALIPAFCGRGYYGHHVHEAVLEYGAKISGCTVHFVDNQYDHGPILLQRHVPVLDDDTPEALADRVFAAELEALPEALALLAAGRVDASGRHVRIRPAR